MSVSRRFIAVTTVASAVVSLAISFTGVAAGASAPSIPSAIVSVHANPGHVLTRLYGGSCGGFITVTATGTGGGSGKAACGHASVSVAASPGGSFNATFASPTQATFACQANALFASKAVDVVCTENAD